MSTKSRSEIIRACGLARDGIDKGGLNQERCREIADLLSAWLEDSAGDHPISEGEVRDSERPRA